MKYGDAKKKAYAVIKLHEQVKNNIELVNTKYKKRRDNGVNGAGNFKVGDLIWLYMKNEEFSN